MRMKFVGAACASALAAAFLATSPAAAATLYGPSAYLSFADSPFTPASYAHFYLEDFEDGLFNTPGVTATSPGGAPCVTHTTFCQLTANNIDSVGNGGVATTGHSLYTGTGSITLTFDANVLGSLPTAAGLVWTDGDNTITFEAFDQNGASLGKLYGNSADQDNYGGTAEDRFYGATNDGGISRLVIFNPDGIEIDHVQYGVGAAAVPEPAAWALMTLGFGGLGAALRRRQRRLVPA